ncbi:MAG: lamin tail domain-containing protein, partial [Bacteroidota bacterium]
MRESTRSFRKKPSPIVIRIETCTSATLTGNALKGTDLSIFLGFIALALTTQVGESTAGSPVYRESFDGVAPPLLSAGWESSMLRTAGANDFQGTSSSPHSAPNAIQCTNATLGQWITSPSIPAGDFIPTHLSFWTKRSGTFQADLLVEASSGNTAGVFVMIGDTIRYSGGTGYERQEISLPPEIVRQSPVRLRWRVIPGSAGNTGTLRIDDVEVTARCAVDLLCGRVEVHPSAPRDGDSIDVCVMIQNQGIFPSLTRKLALFSSHDLDSNSQRYFRVSEVVSTDSLLPGDSSRVILRIIALAPGGKLCAVVSEPGDGEKTNDSASVFLPVSYSPGVVVINEIMYAPGVGEPEWVELANPGGDSIRLASWSMSDASTSSRHILSSRDAVLLPHGFALLTRDATGILATYGELGCPVVQVSGFPSLNNAGDAVVLFDHTGLTMDSVVYSAAWGGSAGKSIERRDMAGGSLDPMNWTQSIDSNSATPGRGNSMRRLARDVAIRVGQSLVENGKVIVRARVHNDGMEPVSRLRVVLLIDEGIDTAFASAKVVADRYFDGIAAGDSGDVELEWGQPMCGLTSGWLFADDPADQRQENNRARFVIAVPAVPGRLIINEIMFHPISGQPEYIELYNPGDDAVDVRRWKVHDGSSGAESDPRNVFSEAASGVPRKGYLLVTTDTTFCSTWGKAPGPACAGVVLLRGAFLLNDDADEVVVHDAAGTIIDSVPYRSEWHNPAVVNTTGRSLERIGPMMPSTEARSWTTCTAREGGTPGRTNSAFASSPPLAPGIQCLPNPFSPDGDGVDDVTVVRYAIPLSVSTLSIFVYDITGKRIRRISDHDAGVSYGAAVWDGRRDDGVRAPLGLYIVLLQAAANNGETLFEARCIVVLA